MVFSSEHFSGAIPFCGQADLGFPAPNAGASDYWDRLPPAWVFQAAHRVARRTRGELEDIVSDIRLEAVLLCDAGETMRRAIDRAEKIAERRAMPESLTCYRPQNIGRCGATGARVTPAEWRALYAWIARELPAGRPRHVLERTLRGDSLELVAAQLRISRGAAKTARSKALMLCRRALDRA